MVRRLWFVGYGSWVMVRGLWFVGYGLKGYGLMVAVGFDGSPRRADGQVPFVRYIRNNTTYTEIERPSLTQAPPPRTQPL